MRVNRGLLGWGLFFVVIGAVPLAVRQGLVSEETVAMAWRLWPLLLILAGVGLVLRGTPIEALAGLGAAVIFGLIGGGLIAGGDVPAVGCGDETGSRPFEARSGELGERAAVELQLDCGELNVGIAPGAGWRVEGTDEDGSGPSVESGSDRLAVRTRGSADLLTPRHARWTVALPAATRLDLDAEVNAGAARLDLDGASLGRLRVSVNAGEATIDLGGAGAIDELEVQLNAVGSSRLVLPALPFSGSVEANAAGGVRLCAPSDVGLRLTVGDSLASSHNYASRGLVQRGDAWETPGYDGAATRIDLRTQVNAGSFELEPEGCDA